jgi:hypothetical protein
MWHRVSARTPLHALFVAHVRQHCLAQLSLLQSHAESCQIRRKLLHVMVVVLRVLTQIIARQFSLRPCLVKRMSEQIIFCDSRLKSLEEFGSIHNYPSPPVTTYYKGSRGERQVNLTERLQLLE